MALGYRAPATSCRVGSVSGNYRVGQGIVSQKSKPNLPECTTYPTLYDINLGAVATDQARDFLNRFAFKLNKVKNLVVVSFYRSPELSKDLL